MEENSFTSWSAARFSSLSLLQLLQENLVVIMERHQPLSPRICMLLLLSIIAAVGCVIPKRELASNKYITILMSLQQIKL
jgi:hypothetical protein